MVWSDYMCDLFPEEVATGLWKLRFLPDGRSRSEEPHKNNSIQQIVSSASADPIQDSVIKGFGKKA